MINKTSGGFGLRNLDGYRFTPYVFSIKGSKISSLYNITMISAQVSFMYIENSQVDLIDTIVLNGASNGIKVKDSTIELIKNIEISGSGSYRSRTGMIYNDNSNITITNSIFTNNTAIYGTAFYLICDGKFYCENFLVNITIAESIAIVYGGGIYYDIYRPKMTNITFSNNIAPYGPDIASYPVKLALIDSEASNIELFDIVSGQQYNGSISFNLIDIDNQVTSEGSIGSVKFRASNNYSSIEGSTSQGLIDGVATFSDLTFIADPGSKNVEYLISSDAIDSSKILKEFGVNTIQEPAIVNFRY